MGSNRTSKATPKSAVPATQPLPTNTLVIDNGAYTMKAGYAPASLSDADNDPLAPCVSIPNALVKTRNNRVYIGAQISTHVSDWNEATFRRPVEKGYIVNWEAQKEIWENAFFDEKTAKRDDIRVTDPGNTTLVLTEAPNAIAALQKNADEIIMEEWGFGGYARCVGPTLNAWNEIHALFGDPVASIGDNNAAQPAECVLVVDSGYSHTTITPVYRGRPLQRAIRRLEIGGKHLTNYLKELVSIRQYNMVDETYIMNDVKEAVCYVSNDFASDIEKTWKGNRKRGMPDPGEGVVVDYILPDPNTHKKGFMRPHNPLLAAKKKKGLLSGEGSDVAAEDVMVLGNERFTVPELLFNPGDIGMKQAGIPEIILQSLSVLPTGLHPPFLANILVVGGNALIPGFIERLESEIRQMASAECVVRVKKPADPIRSTWLGGARFATNHEAVKEVAVTRQEYLEHGSVWVGRKFSNTLS